MKSSTTLLLAIGGIALLVATTQAKDADAKPKTPTTPLSERDCIREAAELITSTVKTASSPVQVAVAKKLRELGLDLAAECIDKLAEGQDPACAALLVGPIEEGLRKVRDPEQLRKLAASMRQAGFKDIAECLEGEASKYEQTA